MTTIRDSLESARTWAEQDGSAVAAVLLALGIDPDLPAEWATVDRCLTWLRAGEDFGLTVIDGGYGVEWRQADDSLRVVHAPTLHAALIAACKAVQEATP